MKHGWSTIKFENFYVYNLKCHDTIIQTFPIGISTFYTLIKNSNVVETFVKFISILLINVVKISSLLCFALLLMILWFKNKSKFIENLRLFNFGKIIKKRYKFSLGKEVSDSTNRFNIIIGFSLQHKKCSEKWKEGKYSIKKLYSLYT